MTMGSRIVDLLAHIEANLAPPNERGCELWLLSTNSAGYGQVRHLGKAYKVHRERYKRRVGDPGPSLRHTCDTPRCAALAHLVPGTQQQNIADMMARGRCRSRGQPGEAHGCSKLTEDQVREIRASPLGCHRLAKLYGMSPTQIKAIRRRTSWKHLVD